MKRCALGAAWWTCAACLQPLGPPLDGVDLEGAQSMVVVSTDASGAHQILPLPLPLLNKLPWSGSTDQAELLLYGCELEALAVTSEQVWRSAPGCLPPTQRRYRHSPAGGRWILEEEPTIPECDRCQMGPLLVEGPADLLVGANHGVASATVLGPGRVLIVLGGDRVANELEPAANELEWVTRTATAGRRLRAVLPGGGPLPDLGVVGLLPDGRIFAAGAALWMVELRPTPDDPREAVFTLLLDDLADLDLTNRLGAWTRSPWGTTLIAGSRGSLSDYYSGELHRLVLPRPKPEAGPDFTADTSLAVVGQKVVLTGVGDRDLETGEAYYRLTGTGREIRMTHFAWLSARGEAPVFERPGRVELLPRESVALGGSAYLLAEPGLILRASQGVPLVPIVELEESATHLISMRDRLLVTDSNTQARSVFVEEPLKCEQVGVPAARMLLFDGERVALLSVHGDVLHWLRAEPPPSCSLD